MPTNKELLNKSIRFPESASAEKAWKDGLSKKVCAVCKEQLTESESLSQPPAGIDHRCTNCRDGRTWERDEGSSIGGMWV